MHFIFLRLYIRTVLLIESVTMLQAGTYTCVAELPGTSKSTSVTLNVEAPVTGFITWRQNPITVRAQIGTGVAIDCKPTSTSELPPTSTS